MLVSSTSISDTSFSVIIQTFTCGHGCE